MRQTAFVARGLGAVDVPETTAEFDDVLAAYRSELRGTAAARRTARFILLNPPIPLPVRPAYGVLSSVAVSMMPWWTRFPLRLPYLPVTEATAVRGSGIAMTSAIRWALGPGPTRGEAPETIESPS